MPAQSVAFAKSMDYSSRYRGSSVVEDIDKFPKCDVSRFALAVVVMVAALSILPSIVVSSLMWADENRNKLRVGEIYDAAKSPDGDVMSADISFTMTGAYGGSALSNFFTTTSRNDLAIGAIAFFHIAMFKYTLDWLVNTSIDPDKVAIFRIVVSRYMMDPIAAFSRRTGRLHGLRQLLGNNQIPEGPKLKRRLIVAAVLGGLLWAGNAALAGVVSGLSASSPRASGFAVKKGETTEMVATAGLLGTSSLSDGLGTRRCFPMALIEESFSAVTPRNAYLFCTNIIRTNARYFPTDGSDPRRVKNMTSMGVVSQAALASNVVMPGIDNGLVLVPPRACWKDEGTALGFLTINPVIKVAGADPQVRFVDEAGTYNFTKITEQLSNKLVDSETITLSLATDAGLRGQVVDDACTEWLEHYGQRVAAGLKMGFRSVRAPAAESKTSTLAPAAFRTCLVAWMLSGIAGMVGGFLFILTVAKGGRQVDEINDMAVSHAIPGYCAYPIQMMPSRAVLTIRARVEPLPDGSFPPETLSETTANRLFNFSSQDENRLRGNQTDRCHLAVCLAGNFVESQGMRFAHGRGRRKS